MPEDQWPEFKARAIACYQAASPALARLLRDDMVSTYGAALPSLAAFDTQLALGQPIDLSQHAQGVSAMVRVASRLGLQRRARDVLTSTNRH